MRLNRTLALGASMLVLASACTTGGGSTSAPSTSASPPPASQSAAPTEAPKPTLRVGSAGFYESQLMAEIYAQALEAQGWTVERKLGIGARDVLEAALKAGEIDLTPEYIGSTLSFFKGQPTSDAAGTVTLLQAAYDAAGYSVTVLDPTPAQDQNGFVVRKDTADQYSLTTLSDLAKVSKDLVFGGPPECETNPVCIPGLKATYGIEFKEFKKLDACGSLGPTALEEKAIDVAELCTTQPEIQTKGFVLLADDKSLQPVDNLSPIVRNDYLATTDAEAFRKVLNEVSARMETADLLKFGFRVGIDKEDVAVVAADWLKEYGFVQ